MKIRPVGAELFRTDGRTDGQAEMTKLTVALSNSANAPTNSSLCAKGQIGNGLRLSQWDEVAPKESLNIYFETSAT